MINKFTKALKNLSKSQRGMTGLETAIILIAFVTVAAVFGYAILSAGLFSAERAKETIYAGLSQAKSNLELTGSCIGESTDNTSISTIKFTVRNAIAGNPIDLTPNSGATVDTNKCVISLTTAGKYYNNVKWSKTAVGSDNANDLLETGEQFEIILTMADLGGSGSFTDPNLGVNQNFSIQVKPSLGSTITIMRTLPAGITPVMDLH
jgi:archaeal flagellin FlaB